MSKENVRKLSSYDPKSIVKNDGIIKEQVSTEYKTSKEWIEKWGVFLEFDKLCIDEAKRRGIDEEKYREMARRIYRRKPRKTETFWKELPAIPPPRTCSGYIGWRSSQPDCCLELFGTWYISPKETLPPELPAHTILLG